MKLLFLVFFIFVFSEKILIDEQGNNIPFKEELPIKSFVDIHYNNTLLKLKEKNGIAVFTRRLVKENETLLELDATDITKSISIRNVVPLIKTKQQYDSLVKMSQNTILSLLFLHEKHRCDSKGLLKDYVDEISLKNKDLSLPIFLTQQQLNEFQNSETKQTVLKSLKTIHLEFEKVLDLALDDIFTLGCNKKWIDFLTLDEFIWANGLILSRSFTFSLKQYNITRNSYFVPYADYINTEPSPNTRIEVNDKIVKYVANKVIPADTEVTIEYNTFDNYYFQYGFCLDNSSSFYQFNINQDIFDIIGKVQMPERSFIQRYYKTQVKYLDLLLSRETKLYQINPKIFNIIRVSLLPAKHITAGTNVLPKLRPFERLTFKNEVESLKILKNIFVKLLSKYTTSIEQDEELLKKERNCAIIIRRDEKIILKNMIESIDLALNTPKFLKDEMNFIF